MKKEVLLCSILGMMVGAGCDENAGKSEVVSKQNNLASNVVRVNVEDVEKIGVEIENGKNNYGRDYVLEHGEERTIEGKIVVGILDDFENMKCEVSYMLNTDDGRYYSVYGLPEKHFRHGVRLSITGKVLGGGIVYESSSRELN